MAPKAHNYYQFLQVDPKASPEVLEAAFRRLAKLYHPDYNASTEAMAQMQELNCVYAVLRDPVQRRVYDQKLVAQDAAPIERRWLGLAITPYNRTIALSTAAAGLFLFAIFTNPATTRTANYLEPPLDGTAQAAHIKQAVIATLSAISSPQHEAAVPVATDGPQQQLGQLESSDSALEVVASQKIDPEIDSKAVDELLANSPVEAAPEDNPADDAVAQGSTQAQKTVGQLLATTDNAITNNSSRDNAVSNSGSSAAVIPAVAAALIPIEASEASEASETNGPAAASVTVQDSPVPETVLVRNEEQAPQTGGPIDNSLIIEPQAPARQLPAPILAVPTIPIADIQVPLLQEIPLQLPLQAEAVEAEVVEAQSSPPEAEPVLGVLSAELVYPQGGMEGGGLQRFEWNPSFAPAPDHGFELIFWEPGTDPMATGFGLAAPTTFNAVSVNLDDLDEALGSYFDDGEYSWGLLYVQTTPEYRRIQLLSQPRTFRFSNFGTNGKTSSSGKAASSGE